MAECASLPDAAAVDFVAPAALKVRSKEDGSSAANSCHVCINSVLTEDCLRAILAKLDNQSEKDTYGLVCKRWLMLQSTERRRIAARAGSFMLERLALRFTSLVELDLSQDKSRSFFPGVSDGDLRVIAAHFQSLERINLQACKGITDGGVSSLAKGLPGLRWVILSDCKRLSDKGIAALASECSRLQVLSIARCKQLITDKAMESLARSCRELESLDVARCFNLSDRGIQALSRGCCKLQVLDVSNCVRVGDVGVESIAQSCQLLKSLTLTECSRVTDASIASLAHRCRNLEKLVLGGCRRLTDVGISAVARERGTTLKVLGLEWCTQVTDEGILAVLRQCELLHYLDLQFSELTNLSMDGLSFHGSSLRELRLNYCCNISGEALEKIARFCPNLELLELKDCLLVVLDRRPELQFPLGCKVLYE